MNTRIGTDALAHYNVSSECVNNTAVGAYALGKTTTGQNNVAVGTNALLKNEGDYNLALGTAALCENTTGKSNVACGTNALEFNTTGNFNTAVGVQALFGVSGDSSNNTGVGMKSLFNVVGGSNNTAIGYLAGPQGDLSNTTALGYGARPTANNQIVMGTSAETVYVPGNVEVDGTITISGQAIATQSYVTSFISGNTNGGTGSVGPRGPPGPAGTNGIDGAPGPPGPAGTNGIDGTNGINGTDGASVGWTLTQPDTQSVSQIGNNGVYSSNDIGVYNNLLVGGSVTYPDGSVQLSATEFSINSAMFGATWLPNSIPTNDWKAASMSASGQYQTAVIYGGSIYTSSDYGNTWSLNASAPQSNGWVSISISASGQYQTALIYGSQGGIYTSTNYGNMWLYNNTAPQESSVLWYSVSISASGQYQTAVISGGGIYISSDYGNTWSNTNNAPSSPSYAWNSVSISASGQYQSAVINGGGIYTSTDYGNTWSITSAPQHTTIDNFGANFTTQAYWFSISISASGQYQSAVIFNGHIYTSKDYGTTWSITSAPSAVWISISISSSGQYQSAVVSGNSLYTSTDYGNTWSPNTIMEPANLSSISISASGQYQIATVNGGSIYTSITPFASPLLSSGSSGPQGATGPPGPAGTNGTDGTNGINGTDGTNGTDGATGPPGPAGIADMGTVADGVWTVTIGGSPYQILVTSPPSSPTNLSSYINGSICTLSWDPVESLGSIGGVPATSINYTVTMATYTLEGIILSKYNTSSTTYDTTTPGPNFEFTVSATNNQYATSSPSTPFQIPTNVPDAPTLNYNGIAGGNITWNAPNDNNSTITGYIVQYNGNSQNINATPTSYNPGAFNIDSGTQICISTVNAAGQSAPSSPVTWYNSGVPL